MESGSIYGKQSKSLKSKYYNLLSNLTLEKLVGCHAKVKHGTFKIYVFQF